ncbi:FAD-dependent oxidoreductase [Bacteroides caccae]|jgi:pyruvate/2-oxoglutarate dehydrogenase complex dihydrolipoamide dehydrogenase (E3) component|uniref:FAD-dependent oxidoreductase n=1 Tax=Bacteroides caccae TaxID=47678 RepID=UPI000EFF6389|nr:FAD-dependent oxidoreductase [Bacteroides caccae]MCZ2727678.1 FAD-dependent oxidoreductase [Bacteroides caccae]RHM88735.1 pyridine nucleotide-disulfide oxidoreductase [Bacteroides caccae]UBF12551.1 FAD-dependent oxidoreductase [Bacteroides caccae]UVP82874.1 FAD-dependent oxidoreductase [Bacteroides caccae]UVQ07678.1 FAD-dependent oxidoreductase [Bacteroides caccae]
MNAFDVIIIGFGKGGKTLAAEFAKRGQKVAIIERSDKMYGGTCINIGCIPTKTLVHQAKMASALKDATFEERSEFYRNAVSVKESVTSALRNKNYHNLADNPNVTVYTGIGSFVSADVVAVRTATEEIRLTSKQIIINTGAETVIPPIEGVAGNPFVYTSTSIMELADLPRRLVIIGGGYIGLEFASMYASFGSQVTVLESYPELIAREDRDIAASVKETLEKKGIVFRMNAKVQSVNRVEDKAIVTFADSQTDEVFVLEADAVLLATGRRPNTKDLNLEVAGVEVDVRGAIIVDEYLKTTNPNIRAVGDVKGGLQFTYISLDDYRIVREDLFGDKERRTGDRNPVSYSVFIDLPLSRIGLNEEEARRQNRDIIVKKLPVMAIPRAKTLGETDGLLKAIIDKNTGKILGCVLFAPDSGEVINTVAVAMKTGQDYTFLRDFIFTHPSMSEALNDLFS